MADTLKFGPEWLRQLSGGNSVSTPPPSPAPGFGKYKLADYRYGREEMLALFTPSQQMPEELAEFSAIISEKGQEPLALLPLTEEEQHILSQSVNSQAVLRMMGRGAPPLRGRGGGFDRGRGRGRGRGDGFVQRGVSYDEDGFGRPRGPRSDGWEEVGQKRFDRSFPSRFDESGNPQNPKVYQRSYSSENWRDRDEDDDAGDWRRAGGSKWNTHTRGSWRDSRGERGFEYDRNPNIHKGYSRQYQRSRSSESWEEEEMPEWSTDGDMDEVGTFDSSGAFVATHMKPPPKGKKPPGEGDKEEKEEKKHSNSTEIVRDPQKQEKEKPPEKASNEEKDVNENHMKKVDTKKTVKNSDSHNRQSPQTTQSSRNSPRPAKPKEKGKDKDSAKVNSAVNGHDKSKTEETDETKAKPVIKTQDTLQLNDKSPEKKAADETEKKMENSAIQRDTQVPDISTSASETDKRKAKLKSEAEALDQLKETVETMVAGMTVEEDDLKEEVAVLPAPTAGALPQDHENYNKWFYRDPQGDLQGPFTSKEMAEWFSAGYFTMTLQVRRGCDEVFLPLGELIKRWGRVPFLPGQSPPPAMNKSPTSREATQAQQQQRRDQEQMQALQNFLFQQQLAQQQQIIRQLQLQQIQQMVVTLQENEEVKALPLIQQQQLAMQMLLKHPQQLVMNQQHLAQTQTLTSRSPEPDASANLPTTSQPTPTFTTSFNQEPSSIWDIEPPKTEPDAELQARRNKELEEKLEIERRFQEKEKELKRKLEEMEREKQEVEKRKLELQRFEEQKKQEELERKREEEKRRQMEEDRKRKEEQRKREEERRQQELERQQELKRQEELQKQQEAQRLKEQEEMEKQKQQEIQRRQELQRQQELQKQQESLRKQQQEALHKLQQEQMANMQLPSHVQWGGNQNNIPAQSQHQQSLLEIQQQEEVERQKQEKLQRQQAEVQRQQMLAIQQQQQQQQQKTWTNSFVKPQTSPAKSLLEIQDEQARQLERERQKREENHQQAAKNMSLGAASVWSASPVSSNWANDGAWGALKQSAQMNKSNNNSLGFWDDAIISTSGPTQTNKKQPSKQGKQSADFPALGGGTGNKPKQTSQAKQKPSKTKKEEEAVQRLFQAVKPTSDFTEWCEKQLRNMDTSVDIPTFIAFLQEVESPYEVHDYVRSYLGESKSTTEFAKSFLEKRSQYRNKGKPVEEDSIWGPAPAITPRELRQPIAEENQKGKGGKKKKNKMMKLDSSILGFTVHAAPDRIVGEIDNEMSGGSAR